jgi:hypothetical protein
MQTLVDNLTLVLTVAFVLSVAQGMLSQALAVEKGHSKRWFWAGCLLPLVGIVWVAGLPDARLRAEVRELAQRPVPSVSASPRSADRSVSAPVQADIPDEAALVAAVTTSVVAMGKPGTRPVVRSVRRAAGPTAWSRAGDRRRA